MSFDQEIVEGFAKSLGRLQLRVYELEEGGAVSTVVDPVKSMRKAVDAAKDFSDEARKLHAQLDEARNAEAAALCKLSEEKAARAKAEDKATRAFQRIAGLERAAAQKSPTPVPATPVPAGYADVVERNKRQAELLEGRRLEIGDLEAKLRGRDQQIAELQRRVDDVAKGATIARKANDEAEQLIAQLRQQLDEVRASPPAAAECSTCTPLRRAIRQEIEAAIARHASPTRASAVTQLEAREVTPGNQLSEGAVVGIAAMIRDALAQAASPLAVHEVAMLIGCDTQKVAQNIVHLVKAKRNAVIRLGGPVGYRYWLASRPLPQGVQA